MKLRRAFPLLATGLLASASAATCTPVGGAGEEFRAEDAPPIVVTPDDVAWQEIDAPDARRHVGFLASDSRLGRATPSPGLERSAAWLAEELHGAGLEPAGDDGGYLQYWPYEGAASDSVALVPNVVARLAGSDPARAGEYVILVAHYDHLGVGEPDERGDSIYNGADDNASGVAALLEVAQAFGALPEAPPRPVLFVAVSGEEEGLLGSAWFATHPTVDLAEAVAAINMDMIGRNHPDSIRVIGHGYSTLGPLIERVAAGAPRLGLDVGADRQADAAFFERSDNISFARLGIPAVTLFAGLHDDYHAPSDEPGKVDPEKIARVARLVFLTAHRLASGDVEVEWTAAGREAVGL